MEGGGVEGNACKTDGISSAHNLVLSIQHRAQENNAALYIKITQIATISKNGQMWKSCIYMFFAFVSAD